MLEIMISSSVLIAVLAVLRLVLRGRISARLQYALWLLVLVRLLVPVSFFHSPVSVTEAVTPVTERVRAVSLQSGIPVETLNKITPLRLSDVGVYPEWDEYVSDAQGGVRLQQFFSLRQLGHLVRGGGSVVAAVWFLLVNLRLARRLRKSRTPYDYPSDIPVYAAEGIPSPCLFGLFRPAVYLTPHAAEDDDRARQIIAHELTHYRHGDMIWALLRSVCLVVWWFNPFVWLAAALSRQDCELACDEGTIKSLGEEARFDYGRTLVGMAKVGARPSDLLCGATTMTTGGHSLKERVARIANARRMSAAAAVTAILIASVAAGCAFAGASEKDAIEPEAAYETEDAVEQEIAFESERVETASASDAEELLSQMTMTVVFHEPVTGLIVSLPIQEREAVAEMFVVYHAALDAAVLPDPDFEFPAIDETFYSVSFYNEQGYAGKFMVYENGLFSLFREDRIDGSAGVHEDTDGALMDRFRDILDRYGFADIIAQSTSTEPGGEEIHITVSD